MKKFDFLISCNGNCSAKAEFAPDTKNMQKQAAYLDQSMDQIQSCGVSKSLFILLRKEAEDSRERETNKWELRRAWQIASKRGSINSSLLKGKKMNEDQKVKFPQAVLKVRYWKVLLVLTKKSSSNSNFPLGSTKPTINKTWGKTGKT